MPLAKNNTQKAEIYALDAQGNTLAIYEIKVIDGQHELNCSERLIYGSSRLGMSKKIVNLGSQSGFDMQKMENSIYEFLDPQNAVANAVYVHPGLEKMYIGFKQYELNNHLGNVLSTVSDRKLTKRISDSQVFHIPDVRTATEYYPFGSMLEGWGCSQSFDCSLNTYSFTDTLLSDSYNTGLLSDLIKYPYYEYALLTGSSVSYYTEISGNRYLVFNSTTRNQPIMRRIYGVEDYKTYTARFRGRVTSGSAEITVRKYLKSDSTVYSNATSKIVSLNGTWKEDSISFTVDPLYRYTVHVRNSSSFGTTTINIDFIEVYGEASASYLTCSEDSVGYRFGFNGQEKDNEIAGVEGSHNTAEFWMYDTRLGRRWNVDPIVRYFESPYATFLNSPINLNDIYGLSPDGGGGDEETGELKATFYFKLDDDIFGEDDNEREKILNDYIEKYKANVLATWSAQKIGGKNVSLEQVNFLPAPSGMTEADLAKDENLITVGRGLNHPNSDLARFGFSVVYGKNNRLSYMLFQNDAADADHEFGHHFGLTDRYHFLAYVNKQHDNVLGLIRVPMILNKSIDNEYDYSDNLYSTGKSLTQHQLNIVFNSNRTEQNYPKLVLGNHIGVKLNYESVQFSISPNGFTVKGFNKNGSSSSVSHYSYSNKVYSGIIGMAMAINYCGSHNPSELHRFFNSIIKW